MTDTEQLLARIVALETEQRIRMGRVENDIAEIGRTLSDLRALANQGKGSLRTFLWMGGLAASIVGLLGTVLGNKFGGGL